MLSGLGRISVPPGFRQSVNYGGQNGLSVLAECAVICTVVPLTERYVVRRAVAPQVSFSVDLSRVVVVVRPFLSEGATEGTGLEIGRTFRVDHPPVSLSVFMLCSSHG